MCSNILSITVDFYHPLSNYLRTYLKKGSIIVIHTHKKGVSEWTEFSYFSLSRSLSCYLLLTCKVGRIVGLDAHIMAVLAHIEQTIVVSINATIVIGFRKETTMDWLRKVYHKLFCNAVCWEHHSICRYELRNHPTRHYCTPGSHEFE